MDTDDVPGGAAPAGPAESDVNMADATNSAEGAGVDNGVSDSTEEPVQMNTDVKADVTKKKVKKTTVPVTENVFGALSPVDLQKAVEKEFEMALQDRIMEETKDKKNAVEAYVYDMRNKLNDKYHEFVTPSEKDDFIAKLQEAEDWLYEDGEDETKGVYIAKLEELKKLGDPIEERHKEFTERKALVNQLVYCINSYREAAMSPDPKFDHIDLSDKQKVLNQCVEAEAWLREKQQQQDQLPTYATPTLLSADIRKKTEAIDRFCRPIMTKPKTAPPKPATPERPQPQTQSPARDSPASAGGRADAPNTNDNVSDGSSEVPPGGESMETEKAGTSS
ncbi:Heat shock 70 kDa protein 15-like protein [Drosera capensis]